MKIDPSHKVRNSDSPLFGLICDACGATDMDTYNLRKLAAPCPAAKAVDDTTMHSEGPVS